MRTAPEKELRRLLDLARRVGALKAWEPSPGGGYCVTLCTVEGHQHLSAREATALCWGVDAAWQSAKGLDLELEGWLQARAAAHEHDV